MDKKSTAKSAEKPKETEAVKADAVMAETKQADAVMEEAIPAVDTAKPKKSKKTLFIIIGALVALGLCAAVCVAVLFGIGFLAQNNDYTNQVEELFDALHADDKAKVEALVESSIYDELYYEYEDGTIAEEFANNVASVDVTGTEVTTNGVKVYFELDLTNDEYGFEDWKEAGLQDEGDGNYLIVYVGPKTDQDE